MTLTKLAEIELVRHFKPPVNAAEIKMLMKSLPEATREAAYEFLIDYFANLQNGLDKNNPAEQVLQVDGLANFLESNPTYLEGFAINPETRKVEFKGKAVNEDVYGLDISSIDILSKRLSEAFNYRYSFPYKFLLPALKKALKMRNYLPTFEDIEYVEKVVAGIISGTKKSRITVGEVLKNSTGLDKKFVGNALVTLGWERKTYKSKNVVYIKKQTP
jgi:hypothetical protein